MEKKVGRAADLLVDGGDTSQRGKDKKNRITGVTYLYVNGDKGTVEFHTRPKKDAKLEDFKPADRFTFSPTRFNNDAMRKTQ